MTLSRTLTRGGIIVALMAMMIGTVGCQWFRKDETKKDTPKVKPPVTFSKRGDIPGDRMLIGTGYNSATGIERGDCVARGALETVSGGPGGRTHYHLREITSLEEFRKATNTHAAASFGWGIFSGSGSKDFYQSGRFTKFNNFLFIDVTVLNPMQILSQVRLTEEGRSRASEGIAEFIDGCGDEFVHKRQTGGQFTVIAQFGSTTAEQQQQVHEKIEVAVKAFIVGGEGEAQFSEALTSLSTITDVNFEVIRVGASGSLPSMAAVKQYALDFPKTVSTDSTQAAAMYVVTRQNSTILGLPRGTRDFSLVTKQAEFLEHYADILDRAYEVVGNLNYIAQNPGQFQNVNAAALDMARTKERARVRTLTADAIICRDSAQKCKDPLEPMFEEFAVQRANKPDTSAPKPPEKPEPPRWVQLNPKGVVALGDIPVGEFKSFDARGSWKPGPERPCVPPTGDIEGSSYPPLKPYAFGVQYRLLDLFKQDNKDFVVQDWTSFTGSPIKLLHSTRVEVRMKDSKFEDNTQCQPPMTAILF